jgi:hypothetical protein
MSAPEWTPPTAAQRAAANEIVDAIIEALRSDRGVHAETAIAAAARVGGTFLFRSFGFEAANIKPGSPVFSDAANERGPLLVQTLGNELIAAGVDKAALTVGPPVADAHQPHLSLVDTQTLLEARLRGIAGKHGLSQGQAAHACAIAAARLVKMCAQVLDMRIGVALAAQGFVEGSKTMPLPLAANTRSP